MTHQQYPLGSGFGPAATAEEVVAGLDLSGKNVIVTGGNAGIGLEAVKALSKAGASVTVAARKPDNEAISGLANVDALALDLSDVISIDAFADVWLARGLSLHLLLNNAGMPAPFERQTDARGNELQFSTNYLGHFQLTKRLLPALRAAKGARVVNTSSGAQRMGAINWADPSMAEGYDANIAYAQSKLAMVLFAVELDRRYAAEGIRAYSAHPGVVVGTKLNASAGEEALKAMGLIDEAGNPILRPEWGTKTPQQGAASIVFAATSPLLDDKGGVYIKDSDISALDDEPRPISAESIPSEIMSHAIDPDTARRLWELSENLLSR